MSLDIGERFARTVQAERRKHADAAPAPDRFGDLPGFKQLDVVAAVYSGSRRLQADGAGANDRNAFFRILQVRRQRRNAVLP